MTRTKNFFKKFVMPSVIRETPLADGKLNGTRTPWYFNLSAEIAKDTLKNIIRPMLAYSNLNAPFDVKASYAIPKF